MSKRSATIIIFALFIPLGIGILVYSIRLNPTLNKLFTSKIIFEDQQLAKQMKTSQPLKGTNLTVSTGIGNGDENYGGKILNGVFTNMITKPIPVKTKGGKEIAKSIMTLEIKYLGANDTLKKIYISGAIQLPDGTYHLIDQTPVQLPNSVVNTKYYEDKIGTMVFAMFRMQTSKLVQTMKEAGKTSEEITEGEKIFGIIAEYESSWVRELDQLILGGDNGNMEFLFPLMYFAESFNPAFGTFNSKITKK